MHITSVAIGSYGDLLPFVALGSALRERGHEVSVATHECFHELVAAHKLGFRPLPMDPRELLTADRAVAMRRGGAAAVRAVAAAFEPWVGRLCEGIDHATADTDLLVLSSLAWPGHHSALARGIPSVGVDLQPLEPTGSWPPPSLTSARLPAAMNRWLGRLARRRMVAPYIDPVNDLRGAHGLPALSAREHLNLLAGDRFPLVCGFSRHVVPRPPDWRRSIAVVGYLSAAEPPGWQPPEPLVRFLDEGPKPVYVGFGSTATPLPRSQLAQVVRQALDQTGLRAVVHRGWGDLVVEGNDVLVIDSVPHAWLFPRVAAAVHHAGAGTTAAALRAGVPSVPVPVALDQHFWARRVHKLGAATRPVPTQRLTGSALGAALADAAGNPQLGAAARRLQGLLRDEDAAGVIADLADSFASR
jgi:UDP:flavonoid glycosyltransferase YjiC (YdhE family)